MLLRLIPEPERREDGRGRPWKGPREVLNGILFVLRTGSAWADLPDRYPPYQTCHRRFQQWVRANVMKDVLDALGEEQPSRSVFVRPSGESRADSWTGSSADVRGGGSATALLERRKPKVVVEPVFPSKAQ